MSRPLKWSMFSMNWVLPLSTYRLSASTSTERLRDTTDGPARAPAPQAPARPQVLDGSAGDNQPNISVRPATNSLLVNATEEQHKAIELVIAHVDVVQKDQRTIREYEIQYVDTQEIIDTHDGSGDDSPQQNVREVRPHRDDPVRPVRQPNIDHAQQQQAGAEGAAAPVAAELGGEAVQKEIDRGAAADCRVGNDQFTAGLCHAATA